MQNSNVMEEFFKIVEKSDMLKTAAEKNPYQEDEKTIREKQLPKAEKHIMEIAHPEPVFVADALGEGGLVENEIERQNKIIQMLNKMPNGALLGKHALRIQELVKMADLCDQCGESEAADKLTKAAKDVLEVMASELPLV